MEIQQGFLCNLVMVYDILFPFLKGYHLELANHLSKRDKEGWKLSDLEWISLLETKVESGKISRKEADLRRDEHLAVNTREQPKIVKVGQGFIYFVDAL